MNQAISCNFKSINEFCYYKKFEPPKLMKQTIRTLRWHLPLGPQNRPFELFGGIWDHFGLFKRLIAHVKGFVRVFAKSNGVCSILGKIINNINRSKMGTFLTLCVFGRLGEVLAASGGGL